MEEKEARRALALLAWAHNRITSKTPTRIESNEGDVKINSARYAGGKFKAVDNESREDIEANINSSTIKGDYGSDSEKLEVKMSGSSFTAEDLINRVKYSGTVSGDRVKLNTPKGTIEYEIS
jgi:hypothetical protein